MKISVVIPVYNRGYIIARAVDSVLKQTFKPFEIIVVDDGSNDDTAAILKTYSSNIKIVTQLNTGVSAARNTGIKNASGDWIALLDSDDEWLPDKLSGQVKFFERNKDLQIFQSQEIWIRNGIRVNPKKKHQKYGGDIFRYCLPLCIVSPSAVIFKKSLWLEMKGFDETLPVCEDYDLWLRIASKYPIGLDSVAGVIKYGGHPDQLSRTYPVMDEYRIKVLEKLLKDGTLNNFNKKLVLIEAIKKIKIIITGAQKRVKDTAKWERKLLRFKTLYTKITLTE